jgi:DNA polymerase III alpha subunit
MHIDNLGIAIYNSQDIEEILCQGHPLLLEEILADGNDPEILRYNESARLMGEKELSLYEPLDIDQTTFDSMLQQDWLMPDSYKNLDIEEWLYSLGGNNVRVREELEAFKERNMLDLLRWLKYFVDTMRENKVVWGVGRGSSVASYVLFLIGVHKIDSIQYNLDWQEFLR